jgi:hypothetical protein
VRLKLSGTHQLLAYADDVNPLGYNVDTIKKYTDAGIEVGLEINSEKTSGFLVIRMQAKIVT